MKNRFLAKITSTVIAFAITAGCALPASAALKAPDADFGSLQFDGLSVVHLDSDGNVIKAKSNKGDSADAVQQNLEFPSSYDLRSYNLVTSPERQYFGDCWSFGVMSSLESNAMVQGFGEQHFSKSHLVSFALNPEKEGMYADDVWETGGNSFIATFTLANLEGIASQKDYPNRTQAPYSIPEKSRYNHSSGYVLDECQTLGSVSDVKSWLMQNGAVTAGYYDNSVSPDKFPVYNGMYCIYNGNREASNHQITIIGWDDSVPASAFGRGTNKNGAWIIKNSWFGSDKDYMYLSYAQPIDSYEGFKVKKDTNLLRNYTHAQRGYDSFLSYEVADYANVFKAKGGERISSVGFYVDTLGELSEVTTTVKIYTHLVKDYTIPTSGTLAGTYTTTCTNDGYYTIEIPDEITLSEGEIYSVEIISKDSKNAQVYVPIEKSYRAMLYRSYTCSYNGAPGQSYIKPGNEYNYYDIYKTYYKSVKACDAFMQVYTSCNHSADNGICTTCNALLTPCTAHTTGYSAVTTPATQTQKGVRTFYCADCGEESGNEEIPLVKKAKISIVNKPSTVKAYDYGTYLKLSVKAENMPEGAVVSWYENGERAGYFGKEIYVICRSEATLEVKLEDSDGNVILQDGVEISDSQQIKVNSGLFKRIISFFRDLFGLQKEVIQ